MNKIFLIIEREFLNRVGKKSFLVATIVIPLIFPAIITLLVYINKNSESDKKEVVHYIDESGLFRMDTSKYMFKPFNGSLDAAKEAYKHTEDLGLLYIPKTSVDDPKGVTFYSVRPSNYEVTRNISSMLDEQLREKRMEKLRVRKSALDSLNREIDISTIKLEANGKEEASNSFVVQAVGYVFGIFMYMFIFIYGAQIMQGIIEEKTSKVVEVIVSSVRPFQLMMGKILGLASVGLLQFLIWIVLMSTLTTAALNFAGIGSTPGAGQAATSGGSLTWLLETANLPWAYILFCFLFYFLGGYLIYGALFAAVGSAVDSPAEAQQFMFPVTLPMLISYISLFMFIVQKPDSPISVWLSIIPFTSPIAMMGRLTSGVPIWQLLLSMALLIGGFVLTTWVAGRIYRVGILMSGTKVNYKVLAKWFLMKG